MLDQWDIYLRSTEGKAVSESEFDTMILPTRLMELAKEYDITYSPDEIIPSEKSVIKNIYDAAIDLLVDVGYYNDSTGRIIEFDEKEIKHHLRMLSGEYTMGQGKDRVRVEKRGFEDKRVPVVIGGANGGGITEEYYLPIMQSLAMEPCVKGVFPGTLLTVNESEVRAKTTAELMAARREATTIREALRRAGKPGLSIIGTMSATTSEGQCFAYSPDGLRSDCDQLLVSLLNELKVDWDVLKKALFCQQNNLGIANCMGTVVGGYLGGPETSVIGLTAECIASFLLLGGPHIATTTPNDAVSGDKSLNGNLFTAAGAVAALTQNTKAVVTQFCAVSSGTGSENAMIELIATGGIATATGVGSVIGGATNNAARTDTYGGMDARVMEGGMSAFAGLGLKEANEIAVELTKYFGGHDPSSYKPTPGKKFHELYDQRTLKPTKEFEELWRNTKVKVTDMVGLEFHE